jgi:NAD(P)-dependent dehydrogenase (short-subunit alcohol dehydrogenase family)
MIASRKLEACESAASEIALATGRRAVACRYHAAEWNMSKELADSVFTEFGRCDILVNNAGMAPLYSSLSDVSEDLYEKLVGVNFKGPFRLSALVGEPMVAQGGGSIIGSISAVQPEWSDLVYASAKAALQTMTMGLARAFAPAVRCNMLLPGPFMTDISKAWDLAEFKANAEGSIPLRRGGEPEEIVGAAVLLASSASSYMTGAVVKVDGGAARAAA